MSQADGYVRIVTQNDTTDAQRSTEQLGDTIRDSMDTTPVNRMSDAMDDVQHGVDNTGSSAVTTGQLIKANLISDTIMQGGTAAWRSSEGNRWAGGKHGNE